VKDGLLKGYGFWGSLIVQATARARLTAVGWAPSARATARKGQPLPQKLACPLDVELIAARPTQTAPLRFRTADPGDDPDQVPLELGDRGQHRIYAAESAATRTFRPARIYRHGLLG
jgi:hypothetical protein